jgi:hypothetical protein
VPTRSPRRLLAAPLLAALLLSAAGHARAGDAAAAPPGAPGGAIVTLAARSIGSRRGDPPERRAHAALLVRFPGRPGGFIVQGGKEAVPGLLRDGARVVGYVIPTADPAVEFTRAAGAFWGEPGVRELPTTEIATFTVPGLTEERLRAIVSALNEELRAREYRLEPGPSSNSLVSRFLDHLRVALPPLGDAELPGWGWRP